MPPCKKVQHYRHHLATYVDLMVMQRSCSSFLVSVNLISPALAPAMMPALLTSESVSVDLPWSTCAITDMLRMFFFLSMISRISSIVKFTCKQLLSKVNFVPFYFPPMSKRTKRSKTKLVIMGLTSRFSTIIFLDIN